MRSTRAAPQRSASAAARAAARCGSSPVFAASHREADLLDRGLLRVELAGQAPLVEHDDSVGEREDLVQVLADQEDADAVVGSLPEVSVYRLDRADVETSRRRGGDQHPRLPLKLAP